MKKLIIAVLVVVAVVALILAIKFFPLKKPSKAGLNVSTAEIESTVYLDDNYIDKSPILNQNLNPGTYMLKIQPYDPKYVPYETPINLYDGAITVVHYRPGTRIEYSEILIFELESLKSDSQTELAIVSIPSDSIISLDDGKKQFTPKDFESIEPGSHELKVSLPSYITKTFNIEAIQGHRLTVTVKLAKEFDQDGDAQEGEAQNGEVQNKETRDSEDEKNEEDEEESSEEGGSENKEDAIVENEGGEGAEASSEEKPEPITSKVLIKKTGFFRDGKEVLRVRDKAGLTGQEVGFVTVGQQYSYLNESQNGWLKINFNAKSGWIDQNFAEIVKP